LKNERHINLTSTNLKFWDAKLSIINKNKPKKGRVAIIEIPNGQYKIYGHVALVTSVDTKGKKQSITVEEANYPKHGYWRRTVVGKNIREVERKMNIRGYYQP